MNNLTAFLQTFWVFFCIGVFATLGFEVKKLDEPLQTLVETILVVVAICIWLIVAVLIDKIFNKDKGNDNKTNTEE